MTPPDAATIPPQATVRPSALSALRHRDFRLLWLGQMVSVTGSQMQLAAINWHVYLLTKSPLALGTVGLMRVGPIILCSLIGGVIADTINRRHLMLVTQSVMLLSAGLLAAITAAGLHSVWPIYLLTAIGSAAVAFDNPARQAMLPLLVPRDVFSNAVSLGLIAFQTATVAGPAIAGLLLHSSGPALIYALNAVSFLAVIVAVILMRTSGRTGISDTGSAAGGLAALREGIHFVRRTPIIVQTMTLDFVATFFASATALLPVFALTILHVGARGFGLLGSAAAAGSVLAGVVMAHVGTIKRQGIAMIMAIGVYGLATVAFGLSHWFWFSLLMLSVTGAADTVSTVLRQTIRQLVTPDYLRGRMTSINMMFFMGGPQLGELEAGAAASLIGAQLSVITGGLGCLVAVAVAAFYARNLVNYEHHHSQEPARVDSPASA